MNLETYAKLLSFDPDIAEEYLIASIRAEASRGLLDKIREVLEIPIGVEIIKAVKERIGATPDPPSEEPKALRLKKPARTRAPRDTTIDRKALIRELKEMGIPYNDRDSSKVLVRKLERYKAANPQLAEVRAVPKKKEVREPKLPYLPMSVYNEAKEYEQNPIEREKHKKNSDKNTINGWD